MRHSKYGQHKSIHIKQPIPFVKFVMLHVKSDARCETTPLEPKFEVTTVSGRFEIISSGVLTPSNFSSPSEIMSVEFLICPTWN